MVGGSAPEILSLNSFPTKKQSDMTGTDQERWQRVKNRLRTELGEDVFTSWFARMELDAVEKGAVRLSVPTRFLRTTAKSTPTPSARLLRVSRSRSRSRAK
jgi:hypothetical protein